VDFFSTSHLDLHLKLKVDYHISKIKKCRKKYYNTWKSSN